MTLGCSETMRCGVWEGIACIVVPQPDARDSQYQEHMFSAKTLDHFQHPRNAGTVENANAVAELQNPVCGDILRIEMRLLEERIEAISFRAKGCVPAMACGSAVTELALGLSIEEARKITREQVAEWLEGLPAASGHAAQLAVDTLKQALGSRRL